MDFSSMTPDEAMTAATKDLGLPDGFFHRMWQTESAGGTNMVSPRGARGHFQVMPREHGVMEQRLGRTLDPDNFSDSLTMAHAMMKENLARFKDPVAATAAYNGGWNPKKWDNPETQEYIKALLPGGAIQQGSAPGLGTKAAPSFEQVAAADAAGQAARDNTGIVDVLATAWKDPRVNGAWSVIEHLQKPDREAGYSYYSGNYREVEAQMQSQAELDFLRENSNSPEQRAWALDQINQRREMDKVYGNAGTAATFVGQGVVGLLDPIGWVAGAGVGKAANMLRIGHAAFAARGLKAGAVGAVAAEGAAGNMLWEAMQDAIGEPRTLQDYATAAGFGAAFSTLAMRGALRAADEALPVIRDGEMRARDMEVAAMHEKAAHMEELTPDEIGRRQAADIEAQVRAATRVNEDDVAVPHDLADMMRRIDEGEAPHEVAPEVFASPEAVDQGTAADPASEPAVAPPRAAPLTVDEVSFHTSRVAELEAAAAVLTEQRAGLLTKSGARPRTGTQRRMEFDALVAEGQKLREQIDASRRALSDHEAALKAPATEAASTAPVAGEVTTLGKALSDALTSPSAKASPSTTHVLSHLLDTFPKKLLDTMPVEFYKGIRGAYRQLFREVNAPGTAAKELTGLEAQVLAHEAVHAATARMLRAVESGEAGVPEVAKQAYQRLGDLLGEFRAELQKRGLAKPGDETGANYAATNIDEFVAQVMTDSATRSILASMPGRIYEASNKLKAFVRAVFGLLGFNPKKVAPGSAMEEAMVHIETLIVTQGNLPDGITVTVTRSADYLAAPHTLTAVVDRQFADRMYDHAAGWLAVNPTDPRKLEVLAQQALPKGSAVRNALLSDGLKLAASANPILRMMAGLVVEVTTGAAGRRTTASVKRDMIHQQVVGRGVVDYHHAYDDFRSRNGGGIVEDHLRGDVKRSFDKAVVQEILARRYGHTSNADPAVVAAADALQGIFQRSLDTQKAHSTLGSGYLPPDSVGYMPQALNGDALAMATAQELEELAKHFSKHWTRVYGWSNDFSEAFSRVYIDRARKRANGQTGVDFVATESPTASVRDTLEEMRLNSRSLNSRAAAELDRVGAQPQNRARLDVDLLAHLPGGKQVLDFYHADIEMLARQHANRVAGAAALADFNVLGQRGVNNILMAVDLAPPEFRAMPEERDALARAFSEFLGQPVKGEYRSKLAANVAGVVRLQRLGGLAWTQLSEMGNLMQHLGVASLFRGLAMLPGMVREVHDLKSGKRVSNAWLSSLEAHQGFDFGMEGFNMVAHLDPPDELLRQYGKGPDIATRAISGLSHLQGKLSFFRGLHAAQHRAVAEMILKRAVSYIEQGGADRYLDDMGITPALARAVRSDLVRAVQRDAAGNAIGFDITQLSVPKAREDLLAAIHRGTGQIIQRTFIGERGAWAHNDVMKLLLQLRTFGLTAMEKQWGRTRVINSHGPLNGYGYAVGVLLGQMAFALPIYLARAEVYSIGRDDREDFMQKATRPASMLTATLNYSAMSGLAGDGMDMVASLGGSWSADVKDALGTKSAGGGVASVIPAAGSADAIWRVATGKATLHNALKQLPLANLPVVAQIINLTADD